MDPIRAGRDSMTRRWDVHLRRNSLGLVIAGWLISCPLARGGDVALATLHPFVYRVKVNSVY